VSFHRIYHLHLSLNQHVSIHLINVLDPNLDLINYQNPQRERMHLQDALARLWVWTLNESNGQMEWVPKDQSNLKINTYSWWLENIKFDEPKYWTSDYQPEYWMFNLDNWRKNQDVSLKQNVCWNSDDDNIVDVLEDKQEEGHGYVKFLGSHPYKEVMFLCCDGDAVAFHLNSPKLQYLGTIHLNTYNRGIHESFVYMTCLIGDLQQPCMCLRVVTFCSFE